LPGVGQRRTPAIDADPLAFLAFGKAIGVGKNRKDVPKTAHYAAGIVTVMAEDCGPCTQLAVDMAERDERMGSATMPFAMSVDANQQTFARRLSEGRSPQPVSVRWIVPTFGVGIGVSVATAVVVAVTGRRDSRSRSHSLGSHRRRKELACAHTADKEVEVDRVAVNKADRIPCRPR
jgi:hypothetical protein